VEEEDKMLEEYRFVEESFTTKNEDDTTCTMKPAMAM
jgi:hypothetical protein